MKRRHVVRKGRAGAPKPKGEPGDLRQALIDQDLSRLTYLSANEAARYLRCRSMKSFYCLIAEHGLPRCRRGRVLLFLRRDLDEFVQGARPAARKAS